MPKIDFKSVTPRSGSGYPGALAARMEGRTSLKLGDAGGLSQFGANLIRLEPGALSSLRHWHMEQDEFVMITRGTCTLVDDTGAQDLEVGECAAFPAGDPNGHHFINNTNEIAEFLVIGTRTPTERAFYSDIDMKVEIDGAEFTWLHNDGTPHTGENT